MIEKVLFGNNGILLGSIFCFVRGRRIINKKKAIREISRVNPSRHIASLV
jgi:hypothetical protein